METKKEDIDDSVLEIAEAKIQQALMRYEYIKYKISIDAGEGKYLSSE